MQSSSVRASRPVRSALPATAILLAATLAGCNSFGGGSQSASAPVPVGTAADGSAAVPTTATGGTNPVANALFGGPSAGMAGAVVLDPNDYQATFKLCPPVAIRPGTEQMTAYQAGAKPDPVTGAGPPVTFIASIVKTARECTRAANGEVAVKVGVIGRVVAGPAGKAGPVTVPLRIAAVQGTDKMISSQLYKIQVTLAAPNLAGDFTKIDQTITLPIAPGNSDYKIYVGFDEGPAPKAARRGAPTG
ncbi:hypothetical protein OSH08_19515 [Kaistia geumhonensis]|uniref:Lipoprotein n=1 Tax=Kaistia geumhonensis TaxID=410839 RepID=A0ABU0MBC4_9HYPH|nr:hypothetical protein [Kaistia geumhonensis]MCX5481198.1 hypothetical protein [Kaistia geumhonensis]MDQ0518259.1 hypothetical protein [Kaistia geumhonensis]